MAGGANEDNDDIITEINIVPLVDIILVVLIIFMLTANLIVKQSIEVDLPQASTGETIESKTIALTIDKTGAIYLNGSLTDKDKLHKYLPELIKQDPKTQAIIAADKSVPHGDVIHIIDLIRTLGIYKFALNIDPVENIKP